jgi:hypothetical protein
VGAPCTTSAECGPREVCGFLVADACTAKGTCFVAEQVVCNAIELGCGCDGSETNVICNGLPGGYAPAPVRYMGGCLK